MNENTNNATPSNSFGPQANQDKGTGAKIGIAIIVIILIAGAVFFFTSKKDEVNRSEEQTSENIVTDPENASEEDFINDLDSSVDIDLGANLMELGN